MTTEVKKSIRAAVIVLACIGTVGLGVFLRDRVELRETPSLTNLVASNTDHGAPLSESKFFEDIMELLKRKYVDGISDDTKLADGSVRGMIASLNDPNSLYMDPTEYRVYSAVRVGKYEGIGADIVLARDRSSGKALVSSDDDPEGDGEGMPILMIAAVVPGSSADKAGLKPGDWAEFVDDHWIPNSLAFEKFRDLGEAVRNKKASASDYFKLRKTLREQSERSVLPIKARDQLMIGNTGTVQVDWVSGEQHIKTTLAKGNWELPGFKVEDDGSIRLPFYSDSAEQLSRALSGKSSAVIDLRNNVDGDFDAMLACLKVVAPSGTYGYLVTQRNEKPAPLAISDGVEKHPSLTLRVDRTTRGAAEIFALALSSRGVAKLDGTEMAGNRYVVRWVTLSDKAGYTLVTNEYRQNSPTGVVATTAPSASKDAIGGPSGSPKNPKGGKK